jgi:enterochelin esterase-like enzyme
LNFRGEALGGRGDVLLFSPPGIDTIHRLPLLLLLHGVYGCQWNWWLNGDINLIAMEMMQTGTTAPMMIAMPSDGMWGDGSGYVPHAHADYEKWIVDDVPRCLRELFPQLHPEKFLIAGLSMGGYGALRLGMKYATRVQGISAHSSITQVAQLSQFIPFAPEAFRYAGNVETDVLHWAKQGNLPPIRFDCGTEDPLIAANRELHQSFVELGVAHVYEEFSGGHDWVYWNKHIRDTLAFCKRVLSQ